MPVEQRHVKTIAKSGETGLKGDVTLSGGANVTLTQSSQDIEIAATGTGAPTDAEYVVLTLDGDLTGERTLNAGTGLSLTDSGANNNVTLDVDVGIADDKIIQMDDADAADDDYAKLTANGLEGRSYAEVLSDLSGQATAAFSFNDQDLTNVGGLECDSLTKDGAGNIAVNDHLDFPDDVGLVFGSGSDMSLTWDTTATDSLRFKNSGGSTLLRLYAAGTFQVISDLDVDGDCDITGALSKGSGSFDIPHPDPSKPEGARLRHCFVESPTAGDNIYRYEVEVESGTAEIELPDYFKHLNENPQAWVSPVDVLGIARAECTLGKVVIEATEDGKYNVLVIGTRKDELAVSHWEGKGLEYVRDESSENERANIEEETTKAVKT